MRARVTATQQQDRRAAHSLDAAVLQIMHNAVQMAGTASVLRTVASVAERETDDLGMLAVALTEIAKTLDSARAQLETGDGFPVSETIGQVATAARECLRGVEQMREVKDE